LATCRRGSLEAELEQLLAGRRPLRRRAVGHGESSPSASSWASKASASSSDSPSSYASSAADIVDVTDSVFCDHPSGQLFALGTTPVMCTSTDKHNNTGSASFTVTVANTAPVAVDVQVPRGRSEIFVRPEGSAVISVSLPRAVTTGDNPALSALPLATSPGF
jgi:hypothetical protein